MYSFSVQLFIVFLTLVLCSINVQRYDGGNWSYAASKFCVYQGKLFTQPFYPFTIHACGSFNFMRVFVYY